MNMHDHTKPDIAGMDFGKPVNRRSPHEEGRQRQQLQPFTDYRPIAGRPGWEDDGHGHQRYNGLPDAQRHERAENKREAGLALAQLEQTPLAMLQAFVEAQEREHGDASETWEGILAKANQPGVERVNVYMGGRCHGKSYWNELWRAAMHNVKPHEVPATKRMQEWFDEQYQLQPYDRALDVRRAITHLATLHPVPAGCALTESHVPGELRVQIQYRPLQHRALVAEWVERLRAAKPANLHLAIDYEPAPKGLAQTPPPAQGLIGYKSAVLPSQGIVEHEFKFVGDDIFSAAAQPIQGCAVTLHEGDTRGDGPLVTWDAEHFYDDGALMSAALKQYLCGLHGIMQPHGVPVYHQRGAHGTINVWNRRE